MSTASARRRVLLVTSSYSPTVIADMHRVRHLAWELPALGWNVEILAPGPGFQRAEYTEPDSDYLFNRDVPVHTVEPADWWLFRALNMRSIGWRALKPLGEAGGKLLASRRFDLVFISTANFNLFCLGRGWSRWHAVPCVLDFHDPWVRSRLDYRTTDSRWKRRVAAWLSVWMERYAVRGAAGIVAVSPVYLKELRERHGAGGALRPERCDAIPFGASERDFPPAETKAAVQTPTEEREVVYVGAGGSIMARSFEAICRALAQFRQSSPKEFPRLKVRIFGTYAYWRPGDPRPLFEIAARHGLQDVVEEEPARISYAEAMRRAQRADGLLVLGVDDAGYMPSKLFSYALTGKPLLASFRSDSPLTEFFGRMPALGYPLIFDATSAGSIHADEAQVRKFVREVVERRSFERRSGVADFLAPAMARRHVQLFNRICSGRSHSVTSGAAS